jgi:hypothetical protein
MTVRWLMTPMSNAVKETPTHLWLRTLFGASPGFFTVIVFVNGQPHTKWYRTSAIDRVAPQIEEAAEKYDVYCSVATYKAKPEKGRGSLKDVWSISGFWADLDIGTEGHHPAQSPNPETELEALSIIKDMPDATAVIHSGGGLQVWWLFDAPWEFDDPTDAQRASNEWQNRLVKAGEALGYHVDSLGDLPRILRVPGTQNHKTENVRPVVLESLNDQRYPAEELAGVPDTPDDVLPAGFNTWEAILEPKGWTKAGIRAEDGATYWCRPGKKDGHSAVTNPYGIPVMVNFSGSANLPVGPGKRLTMLKVLAILNYDGDVAAAKAAMDALAANDPAKLAERASHFERLDWDDLLTGEIDAPDWLCEPVIEKGRQVAVYSEAKAGKSLLFLEIGARIAAGQTHFTDNDPQPTGKWRVLYIDMENAPGDIKERLTNMGFTPDQLTEFFYYSFPSVGYLDKPNGGLDVLSLAVTNNADLVIIDTLSRVVEGGENDNDTYIKFYKHTGVALKAHGIALLRLDHSGKDAAKGMRGASSKSADVDAVWQLTSDEDQIVELKRTHTRNGHGADRLSLHRLDGPLRHISTDGAFNIPGAFDLTLEERKTILDKFDVIGVLTHDTLPVLTKKWRDAYGVDPPKAVRQIKAKLKQGQIDKTGEFKVSL